MLRGAPASGRSMISSIIVWFSMPTARWPRRQFHAFHNGVLIKITSTQGRTNWISACRHRLRPHPDRVPLCWDHNNPVGSKYLIRELKTEVRKTNTDNFYSLFRTKIAMIEQKNPVTNAGESRPH
jgi:hypothetical protein